MGKHLIELKEKELVSIELILLATHDNGMTTIIRKDVLYKVTYQDPNGVIFSEIKEFNRKLLEQEIWQRDTKITLNF